MLPSPTAQARKTIEAGNLQLNGVRIPAKQHQRLILEEDILAGGIVVLKQGKSTHKAVLLQ